MRHFPKLAASTAISWALLAPAAFADLTAEQVWGDWRDYMQSLGYTLDANETVGSGSVSVENIKVGMPMPDGTVTSFAIDKVAFQEQGDGSVAIIMPDSQNMAFEFVEPERKVPVQMNISVAQSGQKLIASGDPENITYDFSADTYTIMLDQITAEGVTMGAENMRFKLIANDASGQTVMKLGDMRSYDQKMQMGKATFELFVKAPEGEDDFEMKMDGTLDSLSFAGNTLIPRSVSSGTDLNALFNAGFAGNAKVEFGAGTAQAVFETADGSGEVQSTAGSGDLEVAMGPDGLRYSGSRKDMKTTVLMADLPFPIDISMAEAAFGLGMPIKASEEEQDFSLMVKMQDLSVSDMIWSMVDPMEKLPRDPATLIVDLSGKAKMLIDMFDPEQLEMVENTGQTPGELNAMSVKEVKLKIAGAEVNGKGDLTFDNTDMTTMPGMPKPVGAIDVNIDGANGLLTKLIEMGFVPEQEAMGVRMMMGMFTVPNGEAEDSLKSKIEFTEDGRIMANGQQLR